jgi:hypothetical protein
MRFATRVRPSAVAAALGLLVVAGIITFVRASDHNDGNGTFFGWDLNGRRDANITDFFAFVPPNTPDRLVLAVTLNQGITDPGYFFAEDLTVTFHMDTDSEVRFTDGDPNSTTDDWMMRFGGTVTDIEKIREDLAFEISFRSSPDGTTTPRLRLEGLPASAADEIRVFPAPGESPLRRMNRAAIVLEMPLRLVTGGDPLFDPLHPSLLLWVTTNVPEIQGPISDHMGMPNTSNQMANLGVNRLRPRYHGPPIRTDPPDLFLQPIPGNPVSLAPYADVLIYDLSRPARAFPPGRGSPNLPPPPDFVQFNPFDPSKFPNGRPITPGLDAEPFVFPYLRR